jgi:predicted transposase/invertase (TIGR01784 family)
MSQEILEKEKPPKTKNKFSHDAFVKKAMSIKEVATEFFEANLPQKILRITDLSTLKQEKSDFLDNTLGYGVVDLLFSVKLDKEPGYLSLLLEHQTKPDMLMTFRIQKYILRICDAHLKKHPESKLPVVYPLILYAGKTKYTAPLSFWDLFSDPELARVCLHEEVQVLNVGTIKNIDLKRRYHSGIFIYLLSKIFKKDIRPYLNALLPAMKKLGKESFTLLEAALYYILENAESNQADSVVQIFVDAVSQEDRGKIMTIANSLRQEGLEQGIQQGIHAVAKNMLAGNIDIDSVVRFTKLSQEEIEKIKKQKKSH